VILEGRTGNTWTKLAGHPTRQSSDTADYPAVTINTSPNAPSVDAVRISFAVIEDKQRLIIPEIELWTR